MKIRPIFKTIDIFSFIQFLSRQTNYIIKFFLLKVLYLVWVSDHNNTRLGGEKLSPYATKKQTQTQRYQQFLGV